MERAFMVLIFKADCLQIVRVLHGLFVGVNRYTYEWRTPTLLEALKRATSGEEYTPVKGAA